MAIISGSPGPLSSLTPLFLVSNNRAIPSISYTLYSGTGYVTMAEYGYDGDGTRVQQVDYSSGSAITTTYANDIVGLSQVLLADDGTTQTKMLFGFDLIGQGNVVSETRLLLADGLGSVRVEMVGTSVEATTTHAPFGEVLAQAGSSGTTYGFTSEQFDGSSNLLYLRARYYNPALHTFMGKDSWSGNSGRPQSMNEWSYVDNNPVNLVVRQGYFQNIVEVLQVFQHMVIVLVQLMAFIMRHLLSLMNMLVTMMPL